MSEKLQSTEEKIEQFRWWLYNKDAPNTCSAKAEAEIRNKFNELFPVQFRGTE